MTFRKLPPEDLAKVRTVRISDKIHKHIIDNYGSLANFARRVYETECKLKKLGKKASEFDGFEPEKFFKKPNVK